jgi:hypothetical protein
MIFNFKILPDSHSEPDYAIKIIDSVPAHHPLEMIHWQAEFRPGNQHIKAIALISV